MIPHIDRQPISIALVGAVGASNQPVGFCEAPKAGGYQGEYGKSDFVTYSVVTPQSSGGGSGPLTDPQGDNQFSYAITSIATDASACEWIADKARASAVGLVGTQLIGHYVSYVWITQYGGIQRDDSVSPPFFAQTDVINIAVMS